MTIVEVDAENVALLHVYTYRLKTDGELELSKDFSLENFPLGNLFVFKDWAYVQDVNAKEVKTVFFAGHRGDIVPENYLIPIDFKLKVDSIT